MNESIIRFFQDVNDFIDGKFEQNHLEFIVVGYTALALAEPKIERQTKDIDALKTDLLSSLANEPVLKALEAEFGKKSPGLYKHGMYLDLVPRQIVWLPPNYETDARAPEVFPKLINLINDVLAPQYDKTELLKYELPSWMENM